jgi:alginate O-acetyltransferase complex protein AlgI
MIFQSIDYLLFFSGLLCLYFWLPVRGQNGLLLVAGAVFYGWIHPWFLGLNGTIALIDWACARGMEGAPSPTRRKVFLGISLTANLLSLALFKYLGFFTTNVSAVLTAMGLMTEPWVLQLMLPVGLSFFTFQNISYAVDVYRGQQPACRSLLEYATFATYFPQRLAGQLSAPTGCCRSIARNGGRRLRWSGLGSCWLCGGCFKNGDRR